MGMSMENGENFEVKRFEAVLVPPAAETKDGLYFLSNIDQYRAFIFSTIYCFKSDSRSSDTACEVIKEALAKVLVYYYPLAGKLVEDSDGKLIVDCTGEGAVFVEAVSDYELQVLGDTTIKPNNSTIEKLVHTFPPTKSLIEIPLLTVQVTRFKCGGFVLGMALNHCMADGVAAMNFVHSWAEIARGLPISNPPYLDRTMLRARQPLKIEFPHLQFIKINNNPDAVVVSQDQETLKTTFLFDAEKINQLKRTAMEDGVLEKCTTFTTVAAHVWRIHTKALKMKPNQLTKLLLAVNFRAKFNPPLPKEFFGNAVFHASCLCSAGELASKPLSFAVKLVQEAIGSVTEEYVRSGVDYYEVTRTNPLPTSTMVMTSWTRLDFLSTNFGWGQAFQIGSSGNHADVLIFLPLGEGKNEIKMVLGLYASVKDAFEELIESS